VGDVLARGKKAFQLMLRNRCGLEVVRIARDPHAPDTLLGLRLDKLLSVVGVNLVLDVGAHGGGYASFLRRNGYKGRVISFEPVASNYELLQQAALDDGLWETHNVALGSEDGEGQMNVTHSTLLSSFHQPSNSVMVKAAAIDHVERVVVRRLDSLLPEITDLGDQIFLKMDTQGWDLEVLHGASGVLGDVKAIQSEVSMIPIYDGMPNLQESLKCFRELGYSVADMFPVVYDSSYRTIEFDCICVSDELRVRRPSGGSSSTVAHSFGVDRT
jgi:FkbM family methyltransferase